MWSLKTQICPVFLGFCMKTALLQLQLLLVPDSISLFLKLGAHQ